MSGTITIKVRLRGAKCSMRLACIGDTYRLPGDLLRVDDKFTPAELARCNRLREAARARRALSESTT